MSGVSAAELARVLAAVGAAPAPANLPPGNAAAAEIGALASAVATVIEAGGELLCRVCTQPLDVVHADQGTHADCDPEPEPGPEPDSTLAELRDALVEYERASPRTVQVQIGPSEICVPCDRRLGFRLRGAPEQPDGRVKWAPMQGTAVHALVADVMTAANARLGRERWLVERKVWPDPGVYGHCDVYDVDTECVIDWKLVGKTTLAKARGRHGPSPQYRGQGHLYARGWQRAGYTPQWVRIVFLARSHDIGESVEWTEPYSRRQADAAMDRMYRVLALTGALGVDGDPSMWGAVPALPSADCRLCPYYRRGRPADDTGCPGDEAADQRAVERFTDGLIAPSNVE